MELILIRHTKVNVPKGTLYGVSDVALKSSFPEERQVVLQQLPDRCDRIFSSPLSRCRKLAEYLGEEKGVEPIYNPLLKEMDFGDWEGKSFTELPEEEAKHWGNNWLTESVPNGESFPVLFDRAQQFHQKLIPAKSSETIAIVAHSGSLRCLCLQLHPEYKTWPPKHAFRIPLDYGSVTRFTLEN